MGVELRRHAGVLTGEDDDVDDLVLQHLEGALVVVGGLAVVAIGEGALGAGGVSSAWLSLRSARTRAEVLLTSEAREVALVPVKVSVCASWRIFFPFSLPVASLILI